MTDSQNILPAASVATPTATAPEPAKAVAKVQTAPTASPESVERAIIDQSAKGPVLTFFSTAIFWLIVSTFLGYVASRKLHTPNFVPGPEWLYSLLGVDGIIRSIFDTNFTYGRVWPAYNTALIYG